MPTFLWSGRAASGKEEAAEITAETPLEARKILERRGWTDLRQHTNEISDFISRQSQDSESDDDLPPHTPKERLQYHEGTAPGFLLQWLRSIRQSIFAILLLAVCIFMAAHNRVLSGNRMRIGVYAALLVCIILFSPAFFWWFGRTKRLFVQLCTARNWHRWKEVLQCLDKLAVSKRQTSVGINDYSIARYRALAMAGLGRLEEAIIDYDTAAQYANTPSWFSHVTRASIYVAARQYDSALECYRAALEEAPDKPTVCLDAAMFLVSRFNHYAEAKELLARAENSQLSELERTHVPFVRGIIAFRQRNYEGMDKNLREALARFERHAVNKFHIFEPALLTCKGYLAVSCAALVRKQEARRCFAQSAKYMRLIDMNHVLAEYEIQMGRTEIS